MYFLYKISRYSCRHNYKRFAHFSNKIGSLSEAGLTTCVLPSPLSFRSICSRSSLIKTCKDLHCEASGLDLAPILIFWALFFATFVSKRKLDFTFWCLQTAIVYSQISYHPFWNLQVCLYFAPNLYGRGSPIGAPPTPLKMGILLLWDCKPFIIMTTAVHALYVNTLGELL